MDSARTTGATEAVFDLVVLGPPALRDQHGQIPSGLGSGKPLALLCFLTLRGVVRRDEAMALLWDDVDEERARNAFRQALHRLRLALGEDIVAGDRQVLRVSGGRRLRADVGEFEKAFDDGRFEDAIALYGGDFLDGLQVGSRSFDEWAGAERLRLRSRCVQAAERALQQALSEGRTDLAEIATRKLLSVAPRDAGAVEVAASGLISLGRRDQAADAIADFTRRAALEGLPVPRSLETMRDRLVTAGRPAAGLAGEPTFVGRSAEIARMLAAWNSVNDDVGATVVIEGAAGLGKTRFVREVLDGVRALGTVHVLQATEGPRGFTAPYAAITAALRPLVHAPGVGGASPHLLAEAARLLPELRDAFQLPAVEPIQEDAARLRICEGVAAMVEAAAFERPVCLALEDLHRASGPTLELLNYLASRLRRVRVLLVGTFNPDDVSSELASRLRSLAGGPAVTVGAGAGDGGSMDVYRIVLPRLSESDASTIVGELLGSPATPELIERIAARAEGNPRRAAELARPVRAGSGGHRIAAFVGRHFPHWRYLAGAATATSVVAIIVTAAGPVATPGTLGSTDTLVVASVQEARRGLIRLVTGLGGGRHVVSDVIVRPTRRPAWVDSVGLPWVNAMPSPNGRFVALERVSQAGSAVYLMSADRRDTISLVTDGIEAVAMGWSPDGEVLLVTQRRGGGGGGGGGGGDQFGLWAFPVSRARAPVPVDTGANHAVSEAVWSPDGSHIAWVARIAGGQEEVFVSWADGSHRRNLSAHPAQDDHIAWSPDGSLVGFTSRRDGNAELYAYDLVGQRLWRLTTDNAQDDRAAFDGDGRLVAFESTRGGASEVYIMPSLGGTANRVGDSSSSFEIVGWRRAGARYLDRLELSAAPSLTRGDTAVLRIRGVDQLGAPMTLAQSQWTILDEALLRLVPPPPTAEASPGEQRVVALQSGLGRIAVTVGAWRTDTAYVRIGEGPITLVRDEFEGAALSRAWHALGRPAPVIGAVTGDHSALVLNADRQWESGVLSSAPVPIQPGLTVEAILYAPFEVHATATTASIALVAPDPPDVIDPAAPRFLRLLSIVWNADARRLIYSAEREVFAEAVPPGPAGRRRVAMTVNADGTVTFEVDGTPRWRSTLRVVRADRASRAHIWLGGQDTGDRVAFGAVNVSLAQLR